MHERIRNVKHTSQKKKKRRKERCKERKRERKKGKKMKNRDEYQACT